MGSGSTDAEDEESLPEDELEDGSGGEEGEGGGGLADALLTKGRDGAVYPSSPGTQGEATREASEMGLAGPRESSGPGELAKKGPEEGPEETAEHASVHVESSGREIAAERASSAALRVSN